MLTQNNEAILGAIMLTTAKREGHKPFHLTKRMSAECVGGAKPINNDWVDILTILSAAESPLSCPVIMGQIGLSLKETRNRITSLLRARLIYNSNDGFPAMYLAADSGLDKLCELKADRL